MHTVQDDEIVAVKAVVDEAAACRRVFQVFVHVKITAKTSHMLSLQHNQSIFLGKGELVTRAAGV